MNRDTANKIYISLSGVLAFLVFHLSIININSVYIPQYFNIRRVLAIIIPLLLFKVCKVFWKREYLAFNTVLILFFGAILYSARQGQQYMNGYFLKSIIFAVSIIEFVLCIEYFHYIGSIRKVIRIFTFLILVYCIAADISILFPLKLETEWGAVSYIYLVGDKFELTYLHIFLVALFCCNVKKWNRINKFKFVVLSAFLIIIALTVECTTSIFGWASFVIFFFLSNKLKRVITKSWFCIGYLAVCNSILLINASILNTPAIKYIIETIFHESSTLTGRLRIYLEMYQLINTNIWWGVGFQNNYEMSSLYTGAGDLQNGICDCLVSFGIVGTSLLIILLIMAIKKGAKKTSPALLALLYSFITISSVEISLRLLFCTMIALVAFSWESNQSLEDRINMDSRGESCFIR